jgi:hypothetical protein
LFSAVILPCIFKSFRLGANASGIVSPPSLSQLLLRTTFTFPPIIFESSCVCTGVDALAHCVAAIGPSARAAVAGISLEDRACMQEAVKSTQMEDIAAAPAAAAPRTSSQVCPPAFVLVPFLFSCSCLIHLSFLL